METKHLIIAIFASALLSAVGTAAIVSGSNSEPRSENLQTQLLARIEKLERNLAREKNARELLQDIVSQRSGSLVSDTPRLQSDDQGVEPNNGDNLMAIESQAVTAEISPRRANAEQRAAQRIARAQPEYQIQRLVGSGFSKEEAEWVLRSESDVALRKLNQDYQRRRSAAENGEQQVKSSREQLRDELGDENYERYLSANGYPTSARVDEVMLGSPGANAGLRPGDKIVSYDGRRVFNLRDVNSRTLTGTQGQSVLIEILRNGEPVQLTIPRGPIGVSSRGR